MKKNNDLRIADALDSLELILDLSNLLDNHKKMGADESSISQYEIMRNQSLEDLNTILSDFDFEINQNSTKKTIGNKPAPKNRSGKSKPFEDKVAMYFDAASKNSNEKVDANLIRASARACGPSIYRKDSMYISFSDPKELNRVKTNFIEKKLGIKGEEADEALKAVKRIYPARLKHRPVVYYYLTRYLKKERVLLGNMTAIN